MHSFVCHDPKIKCYIRSECILTHVCKTQTRQARKTGIKWVITLMSIKELGQPWLARDTVIAHDDIKLHVFTSTIPFKSLRSVNFFNGFESSLLCSPLAVQWSNIGRSLRQTLLATQTRSRASLNSRSGLLT